MLDTIKLETGKFMFKKLNNLLPVSNIANHFQLRHANSNHDYNLRQRSVHTSNIDFLSSYGEKSIQFRGAKLWNSLPQEIIQSQSLNIFKKQLKSYLLDDETYDNDDIYLYY